MKQTKKSVTAPIIIVIAIFTIIILASYMKSQEYTEEWLICKYPSNYENYKETLKFRFYQNVMMGYYREEVFEAEDEEELEEQYNYFLDIKEGLHEDKDFSYDVTKEDLSITVKTFIDTLDNAEFFDSYIDDLDLNAADELDMVRTELNGINYKCEIIRK